MTDKVLIVACLVLSLLIAFVTHRVAMLERDVTLLSGAVANLANASLATTDSIRNLAGLPEAVTLPTEPPPHDGMLLICSEGQCRWVEPKR